MISHNKHVSVHGNQDVEEVKDISKQEMNNHNSIQSIDNVDPSSSVSKSDDKSPNSEEFGTQIGSKTEQESLKFFMQQLLDIGDILGALLVFLILRFMDKAPISNLSSSQANLFIGEVVAELC